MTVAVLARALFPDAHVEKARHERGVRQVEDRSTHQAKIARVDVDQQTRFASIRSRKSLMQAPYDGGMQHPYIVFEKPGVGERCLARW